MVAVYTLLLHAIPTESQLPDATAIGSKPMGPAGKEKKRHGTIRTWKGSSHASSLPSCGFWVVRLHAIFPLSCWSKRQIRKCVPAIVYILSRETRDL
ncbi:hypothetical protein BU24DRAFT_424196 [Aaosphaeria arxii CBS 175.79]|uniref:Uncharacterized protein n=1 Tax=Aaosphaeria arxii CBS 175.79 TaxID=1450172 RepID=A0A6A5XJ86_9PLEO|nr:uncharacterized protein BU24DRAFT_424196 [Aaosphaeria arxii CBS 175.79]KAF2013192.1 hypothetical protein BU24DRAFT_424196 [Aaosphaeria arxii CBS 175.79]